MATAAGGAAVWAALWLAAPAVDTGTLTGVAATVVVLTPLAVHETFAALPAAAAAAPRVSGAARRVAAVVDRPDPVTEPDRPASPPPPPHHLRLAGVTARWQPTGPDVLRGVDLDLPAGSRTVLTGASGAGKSTLAALLLRFLPPAAGTITISGTDLADLGGPATRRLVGLCTQQVHLFDTTIAANLRLARPEATDHDLHRVLAAAHLDDFVAALPDGLSTAVGEHGNHLSGGQRQRLGLARALLADFPILILDEPTEHLDETTAAALTDELMHAAAGRTVLLLTHRTHALPAADQYLHLSDGHLSPHTPQR